MLTPADAFLDPSVLLLAIGRDHPHRDACRRVLALAGSGELTIHLSVEGGCRYSRRLLGGRPFFGGMYVEDYKRDTTQFKRAVEMNLRESDGLMVFDIVHIINRDWWGPLQRAVSAYEAEAKQ